MKTLATDTFYIEQLVENPAVQSANKISTDKILQLGKEFLNRSRATVEVHRKRKPLYVYYFKNRIIPAALKRSNFKEKQLCKLNIIIEADSLLMRLHQARIDQDYPSFFM